MSDDNENFTDKISKKIMSIVVTALVIFVIASAVIGSIKGCVAG